MQIVSSSGFECEKHLPNSPAEMFNKSEVTYMHEGKRRQLTITYVRYFDTYLEEQNIYNPEETGIPFYQIYALLILMKHNGYVESEQLYYNNTQKFLDSFNQEDIPEAISTYRSLQN